MSITKDGGISASYPLQEGNRFDTENALYAPWYLHDDGTGGALSLFNSGSEATHVSVSAVVDGAQKQLQTVSLQPNAEQVIDLRSLLENGDLPKASMGAIVLSYSGVSHALQPILLLESPVTGFALMPPFVARHSQQGQGQTTWHFPYVLIPIIPSGTSGTATSITSYALVSNGTAQRTVAQLMSYTVLNLRSVQQTFDVPALAPYETRLINLGTSQPPWVGSTAMPQQATGAAHGRTRFNPEGITVMHSGIPGDVAISIFTVNSSGQVVAKPSGIVLPTQVTDVGYLNTALRNPVECFVSNASTSADITPYYQGLFGVESYTAALPQAAKPGAGIDLASTFQPGSQDLNGASLPSGVHADILVLSMSTPNPNQTAAAQPECFTDRASTETARADATSSSAQNASTTRLGFIADDESGSDPNACLYINDSSHCISNGTVDVIVGQQISIRALIPPLYRRYTIEQVWTWYNAGGDEQTPTSSALGCSSSFSFSGTHCSGTNILNASTGSGYKPSSFPLPASNNPNNSNNTTSTSYNSDYTFYWVYAPSTSFTLTYQYVTEGGPGGSGTGYASITFHVKGLTLASGESYPISISSSIVFAGKLSSYLTGCTGIPSAYWLVFGEYTGAGAGCAGWDDTYSIIQTASVSQPATGKYKWVQVFPSSGMMNITCKTTSNSSSLVSTGGIDGAFPTATGDAHGDSPATTLPTDDISVSYKFAATTYLMWNPGMPNAIDVPVATDSWGFTMSTSRASTSSSWSAATTSSLSTGYPTSFLTSSSPYMGYPQWSQQDGNTGSCL